MRKFNVSDQVMEKLGCPAETRKKKKKTDTEQLKMELIQPPSPREVSPKATEGVQPEEVLIPPESPKQAASAQPDKRVPTAVTRTETGKIRKTNQDTLINAEGLLGVADGMGGQRGGEVASAGARDELLKAVTDKSPDEETLREAIKQANSVLFSMQEQHAELRGMGTTLTVLWPAEGKMIIGHVGDSRVYLLRDGKLEQLTEDHSVVAEMVRAGVLTEEQARRHPMRNIITRAVGTEAQITPEVKTAERKKGDRWLVCTDGLHGMIGGDDMLRLLKLKDAQETADGLVEAAMRNGGADNISLVLFDDGEAEA